MSSNLIEAIAKAYDPNINNDERRSIYETLEKYQNEEFEFDHLNNFLLPEIQSQIKVFGLKCFEHILLTKWNDINKERANNYILDLIIKYDSLNVSKEFEKLAQWVISKCVMHYVRNECPQNSSNFVRGIIDIANKNGDSTKNLLISIFLCLSEYLPTDTQMPDKRKKEVLAYLNQESEYILAFCMDMLKIHLGQQNIQIRDVILCIDSICSWIKITNIVSLGTNLFNLLVYNLQKNPEDFHTLSILESIFERKIRSVDKYDLMKCLTSEVSTTNRLLEILNFYLLNFNPTYNEGFFRCMQKSTDLLISMSTVLLEINDHMNNEMEQNFTKEIMSMTMKVTLHPVKIISVETLSFWTNSLKSENAIAKNIIHQVINSSDILFQLLKTYSNFINIREKSNKDYDYLINLLDDADAESFNGRIKSETFNFLMVLSNKYPNELVIFGLEWLNAVFHNLKLYCGSESSCANDLKSLIFFLKHIIQSVLKQQQTTQTTPILHDNTLQLLYQARNIVLDYDTQQSIIISNLIELIGLLFPFNQYNEMEIQKSIKKIFLFYIQAQQNDDVTSRYVILSASINVIRIFRNHPNFVSTGLFEDIMNFVLDQPKPIYRHSLLIEALVMYICHSNRYNYNQQVELINKLIQPIHAFFHSIQSIFESEQNFITYFLLDQPQPIKLQDRNYPNLDVRLCREGLLGACNSLLSIVRRIYSVDDFEKSNISKSEPDSTTVIIDKSNESQLSQLVVFPVLPTLMYILRTINLLWSNTNLHEDFKDISNMSKYYREIVVSKKSVPTARHNFEDPNYYMETIRHTFSMLTDFIWSLLGKCCKVIGQDLYNYPNWSEIITGYLLAKFESIPNYKVKELFKLFMIPFIQYCPTENYIDITNKILIPLIDYTFQKLNEQWKAVKQEDIEEMKMDDTIDQDNNHESNDNNHTNPRNDEIDEEIVQLQILALLSRTFIDLFRLFLLSNGPNNSLESQNSQVTINSQSNSQSENEIQTVPFGMITQILMDNINNQERIDNNQTPILLLWLHELSSGLVCWRDSYCLRKISVLLPKFIQQTQLANQMSIDIVMVLIDRTLSGINYNTINISINDVRTNLLNLLVKLYHEYLSKSDECWSRFEQTFLTSVNVNQGNIKAFCKKMGNGNAKTQREAIETLLKPYIGVPVNQLYKEEVFIKNLPPLLKPSWKNCSSNRSSNSTLIVPDHYDDQIGLAALFN